MTTKTRANFKLLAVIPKTKTDCTIHREMGGFATLAAATEAAKEKAFLPEICRIDIWRGVTRVGQVYAKQRKAI